MTEKVSNGVARNQYEEVTKLFPNDIGRIEFSSAGIEQIPPFVETRIILNDDPRATFDFMQKLEILFQDNKLSEILGKVNVIRVENIKIPSESIEKLESKRLQETAENVEQNFHSDELREEDREIFGFITPDELPQQYQARRNPTIIISNEEYAKGAEQLAEKINQAGTDIKDLLSRNGFTETFCKKIEEIKTSRPLSGLDIATILDELDESQVQDQVAFRRKVNKQCYFAFPHRGMLYLLRNDLHRHKLGNWYEEGVGEKKQDYQGPDATIELLVYRITGRRIGPLTNDLRSHSN